MNTIRTLGLLALTTLITAPILAQDAAILIRGGVLKSASAEARPGSVLIHQGRIIASGESIEAPPGARIIELQGAQVYPGFIDLWTSLGFADAKPAEEGRASREGAPADLEAGPPVTMPLARRKGLRPSYPCADFYAADAAAIRDYRAGGFTTVQLLPRWGYLAGRGAIVRLREGPRRDLVIKPDGLVLGGFFSGGGQGYPDSAMGVMAHLRQFFMDARRHGHILSIPGAPPPPYDPDLALIADSMRGGPGVIFQADKENDIRRALALQAEFGFPITLAGAEQGFRLAPELALRKIPVVASLAWESEPKKPQEPEVLGPFQSEGEAIRESDDATAEARAGGGEKSADPDAAEAEAELARLKEGPAVLKVKHQRWLEQRDNILALHKAGVPLALTARGLRSPAEIFERIRSLKDAGLPADAAIEALTITPARWLGLESLLGSLEVGRLAHLTILSAPLGEPDCKVLMLVIDGEVFDFASAAKSSEDRPGAGPRKNPEAGRPERSPLVTGRWSVKIDGQNIEPELELEQRGETVTGSIETPYGVGTIDGLVRAGVLTFTATVEVGGQVVKLEATARLESSDSLAGTISSPMGRDQKWTARRKPKFEVSSPHRHGPLDGCICEGAGGLERSRR